MVSPGLLIMSYHKGSGLSRIFLIFVAISKKDETVLCSSAKLITSPILLLIPELSNLKGQYFFAIS